MAKAIPHLNKFDLPLMQDNWKLLKERAEEKGIPFWFGKYYAYVRLRGFSHMNFLDSLRYDTAYLSEEEFDYL